MFGAGVDEIHEAGAAVEFGKEDGGIGLRFGGLDPLKAGADGAVVAAALAEDSTPITAHPHFCKISEIVPQRKLEREREGMCLRGEESGGVWKAIYATEESRWNCGPEAAAVSRKAVLSVPALKPGLHTHRKWGLPTAHLVFIIIPQKRPPLPTSIVHRVSSTPPPKRPKPRHWAPSEPHNHWG